MKLALDRRIAPEHVRLGLWCEKNGLKPEAMAHFTTAAAPQPARPGDVAPPRLCPASWPLDEPRADRRRGARGPGPAARRPSLGAAAAQVGGRAARSSPSRRGRGEPGEDQRPAGDPLDRPDLRRVHAGRPEDGRAPARPDRCAAVVEAAGGPGRVWRRPRVAGGRGPGAEGRASRAITASGSST